MRQRVGEIGWVLDHLVDLDADFRALYHMTPADVLDIPGPHFLALAWRTTAFQGVMGARLAALENETGPNTRGRAARPGDRVVESSRTQIMASDLGDLIEFG